MLRRSPLPVVLACLLCLPVVFPAAAQMIELEAYRFDPVVGEPAIPADLAATPQDYAAHGYYLVQANGPIEEDWQQTLEAAGATVYGYLADYTFLAGLERASRDRVAALAGVRWIGLFHPAYKISPNIGKSSFVGPLRREDPCRWLFVRVFDNLDGVASEIAALGGEIRERSDDGFSRRLVVRAPSELVPSFARIRDVWWIEEQPECLTMNNTTRWVVQSNVSGWTPLWDHGIYGQDEIFTLMDTGLDYNACWFREYGSPPPQPGPNHRKVIDYSLYGGSQYDGCDTGHGSHVAGTVCGDQSYINPGNIDYNGMAYRAKVTVQDVGSDDIWACSTGSLNVPGSLTAAFNASYGLGARVHTNSWGSSAIAYDGYSVDVDNAMWSHPDFLVCFAAGNSGPDGGTAASPGTAKNCITAGATNQAPQQDVVAEYSSRGPAPDGRLKPTVMAPGGSTSGYINSVNNDPGDPPNPTCSVQGNPFMGTSMATPAIAGTALNVRTYFRTGFYPGGEMGGDDPLIPSGALIKATLVSSTDDMASADIPNMNEGWGRICADQALFFVGDTRELIAQDVTPGLQTGGTWNTTFEVDSPSEPLCVTLVWTDYPGSSGGGISLVNDLDLTVTAPGGSIYRGNVFSGGWSTTGGSADRRNVEECVRRQQPGTGVWSVEVRGYNVPHGPQPFALAVNGAFANWPPGGFSDSEEPAAPALAHGSVTMQPNPSGGMTTLSYTVPAGYAGGVQLQILDVSGRVVRGLVDKGQRGGTYQVSWDGLDDSGRTLPDGVYFAKLVAAGETFTGKIVLKR